MPLVGDRAWSNFVAEPVPVVGELAFWLDNPQFVGTSLSRGPAASMVQVNQTGDYAVVVEASFDRPAAGRVQLVVLTPDGRVTVPTEVPIVAKGNGEGWGAIVRRLRFEAGTNVFGASTQDMAAEPGVSYRFLSGRLSLELASISVPLYFLRAWHTYAWANYGPVYEPSMFDNFDIGSIDHDACQVACALRADGQWTVLYAPASGHSLHTVGPRAIDAHQPDSVNVTGLSPNTEYSMTLLANIVDPNPVGLPISGQFYSPPKMFRTLS